MNYPGQPISLARPRMSSKNHKVFDSQKTERLQAQYQIMAQHGSSPLLTGPLHLQIIFYMKMPTRKKHPVTKEEYYPQKYHITRPDISNCIKWVEDVLTGIVYSDDAIIASISSRKVYGTKPKTVITLTKLPPSEIKLYQL